MSTLKFADVHNLVTVLSKPTESEGFEQMVDFFNANPIKYALTVNPTVYTSCIEQFWTTGKAKTVNGKAQLQALVDEKKVIITESTVRIYLQLEDAEETTKTTQAMEIESLKRRVKKLEKKKRSRTHKLKRLYKVRFSATIESSKDEGLGEEDASKQGRIANIDANKDIYLVNVHTDKDIFGVNDLDDDEVIVEDAKMLFDVADDLKGEEVFISQEVPLKEVNVAATTTIAAIINDITLAKALMVKDKGKGKMVELEPIKKLSKKDQLMLDEEPAFKLQALEEEEERIAKEKAQQIEEVNIHWDDVQAKINANYELAQRLQAEKQDELIDAEKAKLYMEFLEKRRNSGQLQAIVDRKKILITESTVRRDLQLEDVEGVDCLPNAAIFEQLTLMGYGKISQKLTFYKEFFSPQWKFLIHTIFQCLSSTTTTWNEFSSTMASVIICLATNQKFKFSKYIFEGLVKNLDNVNKFLMYPRFVQVFLNKQLEGMSNHNRIYVPPSHTKNIFRNMRRAGKGFLGGETPLFPTMVVHNQEEIGEGFAIPTNPHHTPTIIQPIISQPQKKQKPRKTKRKDTELPRTSGPTTNIAYEAINEEMDDSLVRAATTASSLEAEQDSGNIKKTQSKATANESSSQGTDSGGGPKCQETIEDTITQTRSENVSKFSNDSLLARVNTPQSDKDSLKLKEFMELCTNLQNRVLDLENTKTTQALEIDSLKRKERIINDIDADEGIPLFDETAENQGRFNDQEKAEMLFDVADDLRGEEVFVSQEAPLKEVSAIDEVKVVSAATTTIAIIDDITLAKSLMEIKSAKPKAGKVVIQEPEQGTTTTTLATTTVGITITAASTRPKARGLVIYEQEQLPTSTNLPSSYKLKKKKRLAREKAQQIKEVNIAWDDIQAKIDADYQLAQRLQAGEQEKLTDEEKARLVNTFVDYMTELVVESSKETKAEVTEGSSKRDEEELEQENAKKQKIEDDKEPVELK
nr:hypothetical protein [Tanacetum cinerariifolium]